MIKKISRMKINKKLIGILTSAAVLVSVIPLSAPISAAESGTFAPREYVVSEFVRSVGRNNLNGGSDALSGFTDRAEIDKNYVPDIEKAAASGLIRGYGDGTLRPKDNITRVEALAILARCIPDEPKSDGEPIEFTDVPDWAKEDIDDLTRAGIVKGYGNGLLGSSDNITVEQVKLLTDRSDEILNTVPIGESFYGHVNSKAFRNAQVSSVKAIDAMHGGIIDTENAWSNLGDMQADINEKERELLEKLMSGELKYESGSPEQRVHDMLLCLQGSVEPTEADKQLILDLRNTIIHADTVEALADASTDILRNIGAAALFDIQAFKDPQSGDVMPCVLINPVGDMGVINYRQSTKDAFGAFYEDALKEALSSMGYEFSEKDIRKALELQDLASRDSNPMSSIIMGMSLRMMVDPSVSIDGIVGELFRAAEEHGIDIENYTGDEPNYQKYTDTAADGLLSNIKLASTLKELGFEKTDTVLSHSEDTAKEIDAVLTDNDLNALKINALIALANAGCYLNADESSEFENLENVKTAAEMFITGDEPPTSKSITEMTSKFREMTGGTDAADNSGGVLSDKNLNIVRQLLPNDLGSIYCDYYYDDAVTGDVRAMIGDILGEYSNIIESNAWLSDQAKQTAQNKIENMKTVIGRFENGSSPMIISPDEGGTYFNNSMRINGDAFNTVKRECDEDDFSTVLAQISPDTTDADYIYDINTIFVCAGLLQKGMYDPSASRARNFGTVGAFAAHEISHAFDDIGSGYDEKGNEKNWWTDGDLEEYSKRTQEFIEYYDKFSLAEGVEQNGEAAVYENMADYAGLRCVLNILKDDPDGQKEAVEAWAGALAKLGTENFISDSQLIPDVRSESSVRVDAVLASMDEFYQIYNISEDDPMYVPPEQRLKLW